jgi:hypothetical protein
MVNSWFMHPGSSEVLSLFAFPFALPLFAVLALWTVAIKGYALWHAARGSQNGWFVFLLVVNLLGIPEIVYLVWFRKSSEAAHVAPAPAPAPSASSEA